jgi:hypothetical protein
MVHPRFWVDEVRETLGTVLASGDDDAHADAIVVLNLLGARGMNQFRDLILSYDRHPRRAGTPTHPPAAE